MPALEEVNSPPELVHAPGVSPALVAASWPRDRELMALVSAPGSAQWSRWSVLAEPAGRVIDSLDGLSAMASGGLGALACAPRFVQSGVAPPFESGWIGVVEYEAGAAIEPSARHSRAADGRASSAPTVQFRRCDAALVHDAQRDCWWLTGDPAGRESLRRRLVGAPASSAAHRFTVGELTSDTGRAAYEAGVARVIEYIRAGDIFQANLAHRLSAPFEGEPRGLFLSMLASAEPWYGAYLDLSAAGGARRAVCSISPELFLSVDAETRRVVTRPIKGTRRGAGSAGALSRSEKDAAELVMIVDLMRNDLGRVCEFGSVRVEESRAIEQHARELHHGVATIAGTLRDGVGVAGLLHATFPPGSVTGAPKIRAMQIINELERSARGPYCGAIGFVSDAGDAAFNVAIRTAVVEGGQVSYSVGAGIVADSDPAGEWRETLDKAAAFRAAIEAGRRTAAGSAASLVARSAPLEPIA